LFKSGFIGILGRPNVGKSTFFNTVLGDKISIVTDKPQTTRNRISGIKNFSDAQMIFLDTPGIHKPKNPLNRAIVKAAQETIGNADILLMLIEANSDVRQHDLLLIESLQSVKVPVFLVINKIDLVEKKYLLPLIDNFSKLYNYKEIFPICALNGEGVTDLINTIKDNLPQGPRLFPEDILTDATERFIASEFIREQITLFTKQEIPYSSAVVIDSFKEDEDKNLIKISATINVEKESQKAIMIGKRGIMLKNIGTQARKQMENLFGARVCSRQKRLDKF
jgi:GTP-binding protein Era